MQYFVYLLAFIAGSLCTIALDRAAHTLRIRKARKVERQRNLVRFQYHQELVNQGLVWPGDR